jgi:hypothetical protein
MVEFIKLYAFFCVVTAICAQYEIMWPVVADIKEQFPDHLVAMNSFTMKLVMFGISLVTAPYLIFPCLMPALGERLRYKLFVALLED